MDLKYLKDTLEIREREIKEGKNLSTRQPIYVVLDLVYQYINGHDNDYLHNTNYKGRPEEFGYIDHDADSEDRVFNTSSEGMSSPVEVTRFFTDRIIAFFLTNEAAEAYLEYQSHNLSDAYVYVFYSGYGNRQMDRLFCNH